jgi:(p)ppGpp synthase/HD superfamily hydrolase
VEIEIDGFDCPNFLSNIMNTLSERKTNVEAVTARTGRNGSVNVQLVVDIRDVEHLKDIMGALRQVYGVLGVHRATPS